jgi:hypothetical protein
MSSLVFLVISLVGAVLVGSLRNVHLTPARSENRQQSARDVSRNLPRPPLAAQTGSHTALPDPSAA